ncbi:hypothetical protein [Nocardia transvalensis]|uniref:hypothetical protein n=1 Tax=Nocardia transvalensis TaxID=37333 RepID=UPI001E52ED06|nr:hypothetical protein [Nocardia transvalensis]
MRSSDTGGIALVLRNPHKDNPTVPQTMDGLTYAPDRTLTLDAAHLTKFGFLSIRGTGTLFAFGSATAPPAVPITSQGAGPSARSGPSAGVQVGRPVATESADLSDTIDTTHPAAGSTAAVRAVGGAAGEPAQVKPVSGPVGEARARDETGVLSQVRHTRAPPAIDRPSAPAGTEESTGTVRYAPLLDRETDTAEELSTDTSSDW